MKIIFLSSGGGHFSEIMCLYNELKKENKISIVVEKNDITKKIDSKKMYFLKNTNINRSFKYYLYFFFNAFLSLLYFIKIRPKAIITTGANVAIPMCLYAKIFGLKIIFIETAARVSSYSKSGKILNKISTLTITQWEEMKDIYEGSKYGGLIF